MENEELNQLLYEALETELGGVKVYEQAIQCAVNEDLKTEWEEYLEQTTNHVKIVRDMFEKLGLDPETETPGRQVVRQSGKPEAAEIVAAECVAEAETKDHLNWELIGLAAKKVKGENGKALKEAHKEVEDEEDEHLYHTKGWSRELWMQSMGFPAVIPPPEEKKDVKTAIGAARAKQSRSEMLGNKH